MRRLERKVCGEVMDAVAPDEDSHKVRVPFSAAESSSGAHMCAVRF